MKSYAIGPYIIMAEEGIGGIYTFLKEALSPFDHDVMIFGSGILSHLYHGEELVPFSIAVSVKDMIVPVVAKNPDVSWIKPIVIATSRDVARRLQRRTGVPYVYLEDVPGKILAAVEDIVGEFVYGVEQDKIENITWETLISKPYVFALRGNLRLLWRVFHLPPDRRVYELYAQKYLPVDFFFSMPVGWLSC